MRSAKKPVRRRADFPPFPELLRTAKWADRWENLRRLQAAGFPRGYAFAIARGLFMKESGVPRCTRRIGREELEKLAKPLAAIRKLGTRESKKHGHRKGYAPRAKPGDCDS